MGKLKKRYKVPPIFQGKYTDSEDFGTVDPETGEKIDFYKIFDFSSLSPRDKALLALRRYKRFIGGVPSRQKYYPNCSSLIRKLRASSGSSLPRLDSYELDLIREAEAEMEGLMGLPSPLVKIGGKNLVIRSPKEFVTWREASFLESTPRPFSTESITSNEVQDIAYKINGKWYNRWGEVSLDGR